MNYSDTYIKAINQMEMFKLAKMLEDREISFVIRSFSDGLQIFCEDGKIRRWDAICHNGSYGHEKGLIEVMGLPQCGDDVIGYLTANEVIDMVDAATLKASEEEDSSDDWGFYFYFDEDSDDEDSDS